jgi:uncharacterized SAM-binding protein YcdF (DUF218 family)
VSRPRLVAVLGYSDRASGHRVHEICAARLRRAEREAGADDVVLLSGWARRRRSRSEADLMARSWRGPGCRVLVDRSARTTLGNARATSAAARALGVEEVVLVTSGWHARRAHALVRSALRGSETTITLATTDERGTAAARLRELACWALVPLEAAIAARR